MPATAWDLFCSAWFSVFSHWLMANSSFSHRSCSLSGWLCLVVLLCSARFIFSVCLSQASDFFGLLCRQHWAIAGLSNALLTKVLRSVWRGQRSATLGFEARRTWREEWQEASGDCNGPKARCFTTPVVGERRGLRTAAQQPSDTAAGSGIV